MSNLHILTTVAVYDSWDIVRLTSVTPKNVHNRCE